MNILQDPSKKTSINSLLNPQEASGYPTHLQALGGSSLSTNHGHGQANEGYYPGPYQQPTNNFHLRAASWENGPEDQLVRKVMGNAAASRYHAPHDSELHMSPPSQQSNGYPYPESGRQLKERPPHDMWQQRQQPHDASAYSTHSIGAMYPDERSAISHYQSSNGYASVYNDQQGQDLNTQLYQVNERASVRLAARSTSAHPPHSVDHHRYPQSVYYQHRSPMYEDAPMEQYSRPQEIAVSAAEPPYMESTRESDPSSSSSSSNKRPLPESDATPAPKAKRAKAKSKRSDKDTPASSASTGPSKRGFNAKKRSETALITSQNDTQQQYHYATGSQEIGSSELMTYKAELQYARCMSNKYKLEEFPRCISCTRRWAGDTCRFQGIRYFMRDTDNKLQGISFDEPSSSVQAPRMNFPGKWNRRLEREPIRRTKLSIAKALLPTLRAEQEHIKAEEIVRRPRESDVRVTCDTCMTSLFSTSFMCRNCGREVCNECFQQVRELTEEPKDATPVEMASLISRREKHAHANPFFLSCLRRNEHGVNQFTPVTRFVRKDLDRTVREMEAIRDGEPEPEPVASSVPEPVEDEEEFLRSLARAGPAPTTSDTQLRPTFITTPTGSVYDVNSFPDPVTSPIYDDYIPSNVAEHITAIPIDHLQIIPAALYDPPPKSRSGFKAPRKDFSALWKKGLPLLVKDVLPRFKLKWTPEYFMEQYGDQTCLIVECQTDTNKRINIRGFFEQFGKYEDRNGCWKLKDWPPTAEFKKVFPELYEDFSEAVPVPDYVRRDGVFNIGSHFPLNAVGPDLGPKMYNALASSQEAGSKGSTRLHMDMADALNVMLYSTSCEDGTEGYAVWDLFRAEDSDIIRAFLKKKFGFGGTASQNGKKAAAPASSSSGASNPEAAGYRPIASAAEKPASTPIQPSPPVQMIGHDPIHGQQFYLDVALRKELWEDCGVKSYRVYQRPGDGVFIPAGCAHQVANMSDCIKIAIDFVSNENIDRCEKLTKEFREQNQSKVWKEDVLQLRTMMWFAWQSCSMREDSLNREDAASAAAGH